MSSEEWSSVFVDNFSGTAEQAAKIYGRLDQSGQGAISIQALYDLFKAMDADGSGDVSKEEFEAFWEEVGVKKELITIVSKINLFISYMNI